MKVLIGCEFSATVRDAFRARGHAAYSCDLLDTEGDTRWHIVGDVLQIITDGWDMAIFHPPCTHLAVSGARWFKNKQQEQLAAINFFMALINAPIQKICVENPISIMSTQYKKPHQIIQPWQFGHGETKATCLWLQNLPKLIHTNIVEGRVARVHRAPPSPDRWKERSRTTPGIATAMANQWG